MLSLLHRGIRSVALSLAATAVVAAGAAHARCAPAGEWTIPGGGRVAAQEVLARAARESVVLIGERHDKPDHHRWELQTVAALTALHPKLVLGFEMFPRRVQGALDRWVAGELTEKDFLKASDWAEVWGNETEHYLPLFHFARLNRIPMIALNVERAFVRTVGEKGLAAVAPEKREGVSDPAAPSEAYLDRLFSVYAQHPEKGEKPARGDAGFRRFVEAQQVWDRAMAQALAQAASRNPGALVVGIMGAAHVSYGDGVPHQLRALGVERIASLLPWDTDGDCSKFTPALATAVFGMPAARPSPPPQLLGISVEAAPDGVKILAVRQGSVAESTGLRAGDVLTEVAGRIVKTPGEVRAVVLAMAPGTWLPLKAKRPDGIVELTAKFPPAKQ